MVSSQSSSSDEEINLYVKVNKTIAMKVKKLETIKNLRELLRQKEGIAENVQLVQFNGQRIWDDYGSVMRCGIRNNSTIILREIYRKKLYFKMPSNEKTIELDVKSDMMFMSIKQMILRKEGINTNQYSIYYAGKLVDDQIEGAEATLQMISNPKDERTSISVETPTKDTIKVEVRWMHTVQDLKKIVESSTSLRSEDWDLFHGRTRLQNVKTLAYYITNDDKLNMMPAMYRIMTDVPVNHQQLMFGGRVLEDDKSLPFYGIEDGFTISDTTR